MKETEREKANKMINIIDITPHPMLPKHCLFSNIKYFLCPHTAQPNSAMAVCITVSNGICMLSWAFA